MDKKFKNFKKDVETKLKKLVKKRNKLFNEIKLLQWEKRLTKKQYGDYLENKLIPFNALDKMDVINERDFNYYFEVGSKVKIDWDMLTPEQQKEFSEVKDMVATVTKCSSDLHAFGRGSSYQHELEFENGLCSPKKPVKYCEHTYAPINYIPTYAIIKVDLIFDKWNSLGFLDKLSEENKIKLAHGYEVLACKLLADAKIESEKHLRKFNDEVDTIVFPILREIITVSPKSEFTNDFIDKLLNKTLKLTKSSVYDGINNLHISSGNDAKAELLKLFVEEHYG